MGKKKMKNIHRTNDESTCAVYKSVFLVFLSQQQILNWLQRWNNSNYIDHYNPEYSLEYKKM